MFITSPEQAAANGNVVRHDDGSTQYWLVTGEICAATGGMVGLLDIPPTVEHTVQTGPAESGSLVVTGDGELSDGNEQPVSITTGTVLQNEPAGQYMVRAGSNPTQLLTYYGGATEWSEAPYAAAHPEPGRGAISRRLEVTDAEDNPFHMPELGFLNMSARWLIDADNGASNHFTLGQSTFAPGNGCHELHRHPNAEEIFYVWEGTGVHITGDGQEIPMKAGELVFVPKNELHGFRNTGTTPLRAIFGYLGANSLESGGYEMPVASSVS